MQSKKLCTAVYFSHPRNNHWWNEVRYAMTLPGRIQQNCHEDLMKRLSQIGKFSVTD